VDDCVEGTLRLFNSNHSEPTNIGSDEQVSINQMADIIEKISGVTNLNRKYLLDKPKGVRGRSSDNTNAIKALNWKYTIPLNEGLAKTYSWILSELKNDRSNTNKFCRS
jgi:GDP-D-mannose 3', 5'-epimerase